MCIRDRNDISFKRKVREMYLSVKLEEQYSKDEILLMYLLSLIHISSTR